ncbi:MAG: DUF393 domain-containing protein [Chitinophagaceae bacterium]|nr:DUF393 domain-containing protein [Chitinophagaceae bacterium]
MNTLKGHLLLYDKDCPLCAKYTSWFVTYHWLDKSSRVAYQDVPQNQFPNVDFSMAQDKIALVNSNNGEVSYGIDALNKVLGNSFPFISSCLKFKPLYGFMTQLYAFISMNRKVFIPVSCSQLNSCNPSRHWFWRWTFVFLFLTLGVLLFHFSNFLNTGLFQGYEVLQSIIIFSIPLLIQYLVCTLLKEHNYYDYVGHYAMIHFQASLVLFVLGIVFHCISPSIAMSNYMLYVNGILLFTFLFLSFLHYRRMRKAELSSILTITFILSYIFILIILNYLQ